jgi:hypothetical protein
MRSMPHACDMMHVIPRTGDRYKILHDQRLYAGIKFASQVTRSLDMRRNHRQGSAILSRRYIAQKDRDSSQVRSIPLQVRVVRHKCLMAT